VICSLSQLCGHCVQTISNRGMSIRHALEHRDAPFAQITNGAPLYSTQINLLGPFEAIPDAITRKS